MITFRQAFVSLRELEEVSEAFYKENGHVGTMDELILFKVQRDQKYVQCCFVGHDKRYTYELKPGPPIEVGDYVQVFSPWTNRNELVRVERTGRGSYTGPTKIAHRVTILTED